MASKSTGGGGGRTSYNKMVAFSSDRRQEGIKYATGFGRDDPVLYGGRGVPRFDTRQIEEEAATAFRNTRSRYTGRLDASDVKNTTRRLLNDYSYRAGLLQGFGAQAPSDAAIVRAIRRGVRRVTSRFN